MKNKTFVILLVVVIGLSLKTYTNPVEKKTTKGKVLLLDVVMEGSIDLYSHESEVLKASIPEDPMESYFEQRTSFFVSVGSDGLVKELNSSNYKKVLASNMADQPDLVNKIGKKGYRLNNLKMIIQEYNSK